MNWHVRGLAFTNSDSLLLVSLQLEKAGRFQIWNIQRGELEDYLSTYLFNPDLKSENNVWVVREEPDPLESGIFNTNTGLKLAMRPLRTTTWAYNRLETRGLNITHRGTLELWD